MPRASGPPTREFGMTWDEIQEYDSIIRAIAAKYMSDPSLREDIIQETKLRLHTDRRLDITKFDPKKKDAAIRNTIRNKMIKVLRSKKHGKWQFESLDALSDMGVQIDTDFRVIYPQGYDHFRGHSAPEERNE